MNDHIRIQRDRESVYQVPRRFGLRTMLAATSIFALMLGAITWTHTSPAVLIFASSFVFVVGGSQIVFERSPRLGSMLAGAVFLPLLNLAGVFFDNSMEPINVGPFTGLLSQGQFVYSILFGGLYGYLSGTVLAGLYLIGDKVQFMIHRGYKHRRVPSEVAS